MASALAQHGQTVYAFLPPSQPPLLEVLRRPVESTQHVSSRYTERLAEAGIEPSVGSVGDSYDDALTESIIGLYKTEAIRRRGPWRSLQAAYDYQSGESALAA